MLALLYEGIEGVTLFDSWEQREEILKAIAAAPREEPILLLGHGCPAELMDPRHRDSELIRFNYSRLSWRPTGREHLPHEVPGSLC